MTRFRATLKAVWRLTWDNKHKETLWRMAVNGVAGAGGHDICMHGAHGSCACGWVLPPAARATAAQRELVGAPLHRQHTFWLCPVARAVCVAVRSALPAGVRLMAAHLWLCEPPCPAVNPHVWRVVCLAALSAMAHGRRVLWAVHLGAAEAVAAGEAAGAAAEAAEAAAAAGGGPVPRQVTLFDAWGLPPPPPPAPPQPAAGGGAAAAQLPPLSPVQRAARAAVADFWARLQDFVRLHAACDAKRWPGAAESAEPPLAPGHPFLEVRPRPARDGTALRRALFLVVPEAGGAAAAALAVEEEEEELAAGWAAAPPAARPPPPPPPPPVDPG